MDISTNQTTGHATILLVEDSPTQLQRLSYLLESQGYATRTATSADAAIAMLNQGLPNLVLSDVVMPGMSGFDLCRTIKSNLLWANIPVVLVTSLVDPEDVLHGLQCGADNFVRKPYADDYLLNLIQQVLMCHVLRAGEEHSLEEGIAIYLNEQRHIITARPQQVLDLLISTYDQAVALNVKLQGREQQINELNRQLAMRALELERINDEIAGKNAELERNNRELDAFTHSVSHDLRTPLNAIIGFACLGGNEIDARLLPKAAEYLSQIRLAGTQMQNLIEDLMRLSQSSRQSLVLEPVDMMAMVQGVVAQLNNTNPERQVALHIDKLPPANADAALLRQVFVNLLSNAYKFTGRTLRPAITVGCVVTANEAIYFVRDNGAGFDMAKADQLFGVFKRLHNAEEFAGTGVGLTIVQRIVRRHGGRIWAEATLGGGACFYFTLASPAERGEQIAGAATSTKDADVEATRP